MAYDEQWADRIVEKIGKMLDQREQVQRGVDGRRQYDRDSIPHPIRQNLVRQFEEMLKADGRWGTAGSRGWDKLSGAELEEIANEQDVSVTTLRRIIAELVGPPRARRK